MGAVIVQLTYAISIGMLIESGISFLGLGTAAAAFLARLAAAAWRRLSDHGAVVALSAGILLSLIIASVNLLGDGLRDYSSRSIRGR